MATTSTTEIDHSNSTSIVVTFDTIVNQKLISDLLKNIREAQRLLKADDHANNTTTVAAVADNSAAAAGAVSDLDNSTTAVDDSITVVAAAVADNSASVVAAVADNSAAGAVSDLDNSTTAVDNSTTVVAAAVADNSAGAVTDPDESGKSITNCCFSATIQNGNVKSNEEENSSGSSSKSRTLYLNGKLEKFRIDLKYIHESFTHLREFEENVVTPFENISSNINYVVQQIKINSLDDILEDSVFNSKLAELDKMLPKMKIHIPSSHKMYMSANAQAQRSTAPAAAVGHGDLEPKVLEELPILHSNDNFSSNPAFIDIKDVYNSLSDFKFKLCLLCFSIFPENAIVKRRILLYWWIGEGLILPFVTDKKKADDIVDEILTELVKKGFIEPVDQKYRPVAKSFRMHSLIRSATIVLSKEMGFFDFDGKGNPTTDLKSYSSRRACLFGVGSSFRLTTMNANTNNKGIVQSDQGKVNTLYNVNEQYLKLEPEWFLKLKNVQVLQLGRWTNSAANHIEVEDVEFLKMLKNVRLLMYFSLQGISRISELPDTIGNLTNLRILDLRACHNLEILPKDICFLKYLTHLDMSECYLLDSVPKEIHLLLNLEVLKGFVIGDPHGGGNPCTLDDLIALIHLRKLSISTGSKDFPTAAEVKAIQQFTALRNLKIIWGGNSLEKAIEAEVNSHDDSKKGVLTASRATSNTKKFERSKTFSRLFSKKDTTPVLEATLPALLEKVDLQCFPHTKRPSWLTPTHLRSLKKLYIRGGRLSNLCDQHNPWTVEILCLKHLYELTMDWTEMQNSFPDLTYLELVKCPKLTFFPCNDQGVWTM